MPPALRRSPAATILIVDDNDLGLMARKSVLEELGHRIVTCETPLAAIDAISKQKFDLIVTDFKMPEMNGVEFIRQLRQDHPDLPVILISGFAETYGLSEANTGANAVLQKSSTEVEHLQRAVERLLRRPPARKGVGSQGSQGSPRKRGSV